VANQPEVLAGKRRGSGWRRAGVAVANQPEVLAGKRRGSNSRRLIIASGVASTVTRIASLEVAHCRPPRSQAPLRNPARATRRSRVASKRVPKETLGTRASQGAKTIRHETQPNALDGSLSSPEAVLEIGTDKCPQATATGSGFVTR
jgi:hypothetical protein